MKEDKSFFQRIKNFLKRLFSKQKLLEETKEENIELKNVEKKQESTELQHFEQKQENIKSQQNEQKQENIESQHFEQKQESYENNFFEKGKETQQLMNLSKAYLQGKISEKDLTNEQVCSLNKLLDEKIASAKREITNLERKVTKSLLSNQELMNVFQEYRDGKITEKDLTDKQISEITFLYDMQIKKVKNEIEVLKAKLA